MTVIRTSPDPGSPGRDSGRKCRLGLYMFTPIIGGAEMHFKDLLWKIDREVFDVVLFLDTWPRFEAFLDLERCPPLEVFRVLVLEPGGRFGGLQPAPAGTGSRCRAALASAYRRVANGPSAAARFVKASGWIIRRYSLFVPNFIILFRLFARHRIDVLHVVNGGYPGSQSAQLAPIAAKMAGYPNCVLSVCNTPFPIGYPKSLERLLDRLLGRSVERVLAPTSNLARSLMERAGFTSEQVEVLPYGVVDPHDAPDFSTDRAGNDLDDGTQIAMVASFLPHKGQRYLVEAFYSLSSLFPEVRLMLVGDGPTRHSIEGLVASLGLTHRVLFTGVISLEEMLEVMKASSIVVHPSELEGVPYAILHAMSLGKPVLSTRVGGIQDIIVPEHTGILLSSGAPAELRPALERLLADTDLRRTLGRNARVRYEQLFTVKEMVSKYEMLYQELFRKTRPIES